jgi:hypothetical protein
MTGQGSSNKIYEIFNHKLVSDRASPGLVTDISKVIAAVNLGGNPNYRISGQYNAVCDFGNKRGSKAWRSFIRPEKYA